jgi:hypothetical protein
MAFIQRTDQTTILRSEKLPVINIQVDPEFKYVGSTSFILYDICRVEQHHFVVADAERRIVRQLWFQFDGYLEYEARPTSDYAHVVDFLKDKGYLLTGDMIAHRMIWLDTDLRNELMIIHWETLDGTGYRISDVTEGGPATDQWPALSESLQERSRSSFQILK